MRPNRSPIHRATFALVHNPPYGEGFAYMTIGREEPEEEPKALKPALKKHAA